MGRGTHGANAPDAISFSPSVLSPLILSVPLHALFLLAVWGHFRQGGSAVPARGLLRRGHGEPGAGGVGCLASSTTSMKCTGVLKAHLPNAAIACGALCHPAVSSRGMSWRQPRRQRLRDCRR